MHELGHRHSVPIKAAVQFPTTARTYLFGIFWGVPYSSYSKDYRILVSILGPKSPISVSRLGQA